MTDSSTLDGFGQLTGDEKCLFCNKRVNHKLQWCIRSPCCSSVFHLSCMENTVFLPSKKYIYCAKCTRPQTCTVADAVSQLKESYEMPSRECPELWDALRKHMEAQTEDKDAFKQKWKASIEKNSSQEWTNLFTTQRPKIRYDTLTSIGWDIPRLKHCMNLSWEDLVKIGFRFKHITTNESIIVPLVVHYNVDYAKIFDSFHRRVIQLRYLQRLSASSLQMLGYTTHVLCMMGLTDMRMQQFDRVYMKEWVKLLDMSPILLCMLNINLDKIPKPMKKLNWEKHGLEVCIRQRYSTFSLSVMDMLKDATRNIKILPKNMTMSYSEYLLEQMSSKGDGPSGDTYVPVSDAYFKNRDETKSCTQNGNKVRHHHKGKTKTNSRNHVTKDNIAKKDKVQTIEDVVSVPAEQEYDLMHQEDQEFAPVYEDPPHPSHYLPCRYDPHSVPYMGAEMGGPAGEYPFIYPFQGMYPHSTIYPPPMYANHTIYHCAGSSPVYVPHYHTEYTSPKPNPKKKTPYTKTKKKKKKPVEFTPKNYRKKNSGRETSSNNYKNKKRAILSPAPMLSKEIQPSLPE